MAAMLHYHPKLTGRLVRTFCLLVPDLQYDDTIGALAELEAMGCDPVGHKTQLKCSYKQTLPSGLEKSRF